MQGVQTTAAPEEPAQLAREVRELGSVHTLYASGDYVVLVAARPMIPHVLKEIGRLREVSFRAVGEGTGKERDLDAYDGWYQQLFVWQPRTQQVLGAYRLCLLVVVWWCLGVCGLFSCCLFL